MAVFSKKNRIYFILAAVILLIFFLMGIYLLSKEEQTNKIDEATLNELKQVDVEEQIDPYIGKTPSLIAEPKTINLKDIEVETSASRSIKLTAQEAPVKIIKFEPSKTLSPEEFFFDFSTCIEKAELKPKESCILNIEWNPKSGQNLNFFINILWEDARQYAKKEEMITPIDVTASSFKKKEEITSKPIVIYDAANGEPFNAMLYSNWEVYNESGEVKFGVANEKGEIVRDGLVIATITPPDKKNKKTKFDCTKYSSRAYNEQGEHIGWAAPSGKVYSTNCAKQIGYTDDEGFVIDVNDDQTIIGKAILKGQKIKEEEINKSEVDVPILPDIPVAGGEEETEDTNWAQVRQNRFSVRSAPSAGKSIKSNDPMGIFSGYADEFTPPNISAKQISSLPRKREYSIIKFKPIPAVLVNPIQIYLRGANAGTGIGDMPAIAMVERNVYGTHGRKVVIPAGSKVLGSYSPVAEKKIQIMNAANMADKYAGAFPNQNTYGGSPYAKVQVTWNRIIRPDGAEFYLQYPAKSGDAQGRMGIPGKGPNGYLRELLSSLVYTFVPFGLDKLYNFSKQPLTLQETQRYDPLYGEQITSTTQITNQVDNLKNKVVDQWLGEDGLLERLVYDTFNTIDVPFTIAAGTRIIIYPQRDLMLKIDPDTQPSWDDAAANTQ
jgi:type IV secretory pathway VirB10-like protein